MNTNIAAASYHLRILSPKHGQTGNVKPLTANRNLSFAVKWLNLDLNVSNLWTPVAVGAGNNALRAELNRS